MRICSTFTTLALPIILASVLASCSSAPPAVQGASAPAPQGPLAQPAGKAVTAPPSGVSAEALGLYRSSEAARMPTSEDELRVLASAKTLIGLPPNAKVIVNGKQFVLDCIGTVSAIFYHMDIDVTKDFDKYTGNGVNRLCMTLKDRGVLHSDKYPRPGDVIIWDNTWDANDNGDRLDDPRTHAGVVLAVDEDGTIHYVHENMFKGVMIELMNLLRPRDANDETGKRLNSSLAISTAPGGPKPERYLAGDVFDAFGDLLRIKDALKVAENREEIEIPGELALAQ